MGERIIGQRYLYFIRDAERDAVKIGVADDPRVRLRNLQVAHAAPLFFLGSCRGNESDEAHWHSEFAKRRLLGEWFKDSPVLRSVISELREIVDDTDLCTALRLPIDRAVGFARGPKPRWPHVPDAPNGALAFHLSDVECWLRRAGLQIRVDPTTRWDRAGVFAALEHP